MRRLHAKRHASDRHLKTLTDADGRIDLRHYKFIVAFGSDELINLKGRNII